MSTKNLMAATSSLPSILVCQQVAATETTQYTCPSNSAVKIAHAVVSNPTANPVTIALSAVKSGGTAGAANRVLPTYSLAAGDSLDVTKLLPAFLGEGDFISGIASAGTSIVFELDGVVFS